MDIKHSFLRVFCILLLATLLLPSSGCDDSEKNYVPYVPVSLTVNLDLRNELKIPGNSLYIPEYGFGGIIIFCLNYDLMTPLNSEYYAYDATCTYERSSDCRVELEDNMVFAICPKCGTRYSMLDGRPQSGAKTLYPLKSYAARIYSNELKITNY